MTLSKKTYFDFLTILLYISSKFTNFAKLFFFRVDFIYAIILGIVEGITEFLPISSTGHLIIVGEFFSFPEPFATTFDIVIQLGAILSVVVYFFERLNPFGKQLQEVKRNEVFNTWKKTLVAVTPAIVIGGLVGSKIQKLLFNPTVVAVMLLLGGFILIIIERKTRKPKFDNISQLTYLNAIFIGIIQSLAMIPGTSRSAATIIGAMLLGSSRLLAAEFSFFLAIPTMFAASIYSLYKHGFEFTISELSILSVGFVTSFLVAYIVIKSFMKFISTRNFIPFGYYRIILGITIVIFIYLLN